MYQMIMGAGKTTVIGPMLTLMLADGASLVTQVCPKSLLQQTKRVMRAAFCGVAPKRVYSLAFERSSAQSNELAALQRTLAKLRRARKQRAVVCTTPESVKSIMLKYIDCLQAVQAAPPVCQIPSQHSALGIHRDRVATVAADLVGFGARADVLRDLMGMWSAKEDGIALLDEVGRRCAHALRHACRARHTCHPLWNAHARPNALTRAAIAGGLAAAPPPLRTQLSDRSDVASMFCLRPAAQRN